jgi:peptide-methionine (S)-S-oxide reductase
VHTLRAQHFLIRTITNMNAIFSLTLTFVLLASTLTQSCSQKQASVSHAQATTPDTTTYGVLDTATFASGCFWCVEAIFESLRGVKEAESGYAGGKTQNPSYEAVCTHTTGHTETVQVFFDPKIVSYATLLEVYFGSMDPTQINGQGPDNGDSYRSVIFYHDTEQQAAAEAHKKKLNASSQYIKPIAVDIEPFTKFWKAEAYHQNYERLNPDQPYVRAVSVPRLNKMKKNFPTLIK